MKLGERIAALRQRLSDEGVAALLVSAPYNVAYVTGFDEVFDGEPAHACTITADALRIYTDGRYGESLRRAADGSSWGVHVPKDNLYSTVCSDLTEAGIETLAIEESVPYGRFRFLSHKFDGNVQAVDQWVEELRQSKDTEEIRRISAAQALTDATFDFALTVLKAGITEREVALRLEVFMRQHGSDGLAFPPIVASGPNSSKPHAKVSDRVIQSGDLVKMDFGARLDGYCADMTRTVVMGRADAHQKEIYQAVAAANEAGIAAVAPGVPGKDIDLAARRVLEGRGLAEYFTHGLGHGVGLEVHELPVIGARGTKSVLAGSVITIEPGVYEPGVGGVRIEDLIVVEPSGARVLTGSSKELVEL